MDLDEGRALLDELLERATLPDKVYSHSWSIGDTVIWDNRGTAPRPTIPTRNERCCVPPSSVMNPFNRPVTQALRAAGYGTRVQF